MIGDLPLADDRQAGVARGARLHRDQHVDLLLIDERVEGLLGAGCARSVVGHFERKLAAEHAAVALISSTASCASWTTEGATTLFAPDRPTGTPMVIGPVSAACATVARSKLRRWRPKVWVSWRTSPWGQVMSGLESVLFDGGWLVVSKCDASSSASLHCGPIAIRLNGEPEA